MLRRLWLARLLARRLGPWTWGLLALDVYRHLPPKQRERVKREAKRQIALARERRPGR